MIKISTEFSKTPIGRVPEDGPNNGQRFRVDFLVPALRVGRGVHIDLDGAEGYGSSFLEESFGGLVRKEGFRESDLRNQLDFTSTDDESYVQEIWEYIEDADAELSRGH